MKILAVADIHGDKEFVRKLANKARDENVDLVILAGDLTFWEQDLEGLIGPFKEVDKKVVIIPGNHETVATVDFLAKLYSPGTYNIHGYALKLDSIGLLGFGGARIGMFRVDEEQVLNSLLKSNEYLKGVKKKIMVVHMPPKGTKLDALGEYSTGSEAVREAIERIKPDLCLCGHIHENGGLEDKLGNTRIINVAGRDVILEI